MCSNSLDHFTETNGQWQWALFQGNILCFYYLCRTCLISLEESVMSVMINLLMNNHEHSWRHSWQRIPNPLFYEDPIAYSPFFKFWPVLLHHLQPPALLLFLLSCFFYWMGDRATFDVLFYLMILWIYKFLNLVL